MACRFVLVGEMLCFLPVERFEASEDNVGLSGFVASQWVQERFLSKSFPAFPGGECEYALNPSLHITAK